MLRPNIQFCGIQGSGKGTQSRLLSASTGFTLISTGELLRASESSEVQSAISRGELVDDAMLKKVVDTYLSSHGEITGIIGDGMIRRLSQAEMFQNIWARDSFQEPLLIELHLSKEEAYKRISLRGAEDNGQKRADTSPEAIQRRIDAYFTETAKVVEYYSAKGRHIQLDASQSIDTLAKEVQAAIEGRI
jgi:adenylate kinase